jgi:Amt family ammonium transporter
VQNILLKNLTDVCVGTLGWWAFGWAFAYGGPDDTGKTVNGTVEGDGYLDGGFIGRKQFFGTGFAEANSDGVQTVKTSPLSWFFQWAFCSAASTIVSGGVAERVKLPGYVCFSFFMTAFVYPVVVAWTWGYGWLADVTAAGYMDFAGSGVVHMTGGVGALVGAVCAGARDGRWTDPDAFTPHSLPLIVLGTFILWFGWYGFNCGSTLGLSTASQGHLAAQVAMNTTLSAATCGLGVFFMQYAKIRKYDLGMLCNGILAGLVSITAPCGNVECGSAFTIGLIGAGIYFGTSNLVKLVKVDDPIDAFAVHGACGAWGVLAAALFDWGKGMDYVNGWSGWDCLRDDNGNCRSGAWAGMFGANVLEVLMILLWVGGLSLLVFVPLRFAGLLRAADDVQESGNDVVSHSPPKAYNLDGSSNTVVDMTKVVTVPQ